MDRQDQAPELVPILSRGKHRRPSKGACFMELVSFLAGERWSDHPSCTHPLLAGLARLVNDCTSDANRRRLAPLLPSVIGLTSADVRVDVRIALRCARTALPVVSEHRQRVMAVSLLSAERVLSGLTGRPMDSLQEESREALDQAPAAADWARQFATGLGVSAAGFQRQAAPVTVRCAVQGIAEACIPAPDDLLLELLSATIRDCESIIRNGVGARLLDEHDRAELCRVTRAG